MATIQPIEEALRKVAIKILNSPDLSKQLACLAEAGQLWVVTSSELKPFADQ